MPAAAAGMGADATRALLAPEADAPRLAMLPAATVAETGIDHLMLRGLYPALHTQPVVPADWFNSVRYSKHGLSGSA